MNKIIPILVVGVLVLSGLGASAITSSSISSFQEQLESQELENKGTPINPTVVVHVTEVYGTVGNPQYRNLADVKVKIREGLLWLNLCWKGITDESGRTEEVILTWGFLYKVKVSKCNYHTYGYSYIVVATEEIRRYDVNFTMAEDGSPFLQPLKVGLSYEFMECFPLLERLLNLI